jgi:hypothetical protein
VAVLADETLGANSVHGVHETPFLLGCPWSFCNAQKNMHALKEAGKLALGMAAEFCGERNTPGILSSRIARIAASTLAS